MNTEGTKAILASLFTADWTCSGRDLCLFAGYIAKRNAAWARYCKTSARLNYEENEGRDQSDEDNARVEHNSAEVALLTLGVDPELLV